MRNPESSSLIRREQGCKGDCELRLNCCQPQSPWLIRAPKASPQASSVARILGQATFRGLGDQGIPPEGMTDGTRIHLLKEAEGPQGGPGT